MRIRIYSGPYFPIFGPNAGKYGPELRRIRTLLTQCCVCVWEIRNISFSKNFMSLLSRWSQDCRVCKVLEKILMGSNWFNPHSLARKKLDLKNVVDLNSASLLNQDSLIGIFQEVSLLFMEKDGFLTLLRNTFFKEQV